VLITRIQILTLHHAGRTGGNALDSYLADNSVRIAESRTYTRSPADFRGLPQSQYLQTKAEIVRRFGDDRFFPTVILAFDRDRRTTNHSGK
jgi:hypothetical protein